jgi:hypothetical protein
MLEVNPCFVRLLAVGTLKSRPVQKQKKKKIQGHPRSADEILEEKAAEPRKKREGRAEDVLNRLLPSSEIIFGSWRVATRTNNASGDECCESTCAQIRQ